MFYNSDLLRISNIIITVLRRYTKDSSMIDEIISVLCEEESFSFFVNYVFNVEKTSYTQDAFYSEARKIFYKIIIARNLKIGERVRNLVNGNIISLEEEHILLMFKKLSAILLNKIDKQSERNQYIKNISSYFNNIETDFFFYLERRKVPYKEIGIEIRELFLQDIENFWFKVTDQNTILLHENFKNIGYEKFLKSFCIENAISFFYKHPAKDIPPLNRIISETDKELTIHINNENKKRKKRHIQYTYPPSKHLTDALISRISKK